jgi:Tfp pilus assembly protein PilX
MQKLINWAFALMLTALLALGAQVYLLSRRVAEAESNARRSELAAAAAVTKFESDFFARLNAEEAAKAAALAAQEKQRNAAVDQSLRGLPAGSFNKPMLWGNP